MELPGKFQEKMQELLQEDYIRYKDSLSGSPAGYGQSFRVNQLKGRPADFIRRFALCREDEYRPVPWCPEGYYAQEGDYALKGYYAGKGETLSKSPYYAAGAYYIQEPSAMAPASFLPVAPGERVLDLCAAPGGKTVALAGKLQGRGLLVSNDISASRCRALLKNVELAGAANVIITCESPERLAEHFPAYFDKILVDAPCSGEGMFRKDPSMAKRWSPEEVARYSALQKEILLSAAKMLKPGGNLLYSTCTYSPEEDEQVVETLLAENPAFTLLPLPTYPGVDAGHPEWSRSGRAELSRCRRFWNHRVAGEGQFAALFALRPDPEMCSGRPEIPAAGEGLPTDPLSYAASPSGKGRSLPDAPRRKRKGKRDGGRMEKAADIPASMEAFLREWGIDAPPERLRFLEERAFLLPEGAENFPRIRTVRSGLYLGDDKRGRFVPSQALAMALKPDGHGNVLSLSPKDERVVRYLRGETIEGEAADGWTLVCLEDLPLGWGKCANGRIKNKYNPGWRRQE